MVAMPAVEHPPPADDLLRAFLELDTAHVQVSFGKSLDLPAPFSFALDTGPLR
ncbi:hypothetical protein [Kitasatospora sp. NBC_01539]|uniref:hypothetical protein n=1 Tax=Kitasatospora sp. NBC_01539 TaxID=2903577 RepID=UPI0038602559